MQHIQLSILLVSDNLFRQADICYDRGKKSPKRAKQKARRKDPQKAKKSVHRPLLITKLSLTT